MVFVKQETINLIYFLFSMEKACIFFAIRKQSWILNLKVKYTDILLVTLGFIFPKVMPNYVIPNCSRLKSAIYCLKNKKLKNLNLSHLASKASPRELWIHHIWEWKPGFFMKTMCPTWGKITSGTIQPWDVPPLLKN